MAGTLRDLPTNVLEAFRTRWGGVVKATTTSAQISATAAALVRADGGSWITDGFDAGDEVTVTGLAASGDNGVALVAQLDDATMMLVRVDASADADPGVVAPFLTPAAAGPTVTVQALAPTGRQLDGAAFSPAPPAPWFRETHQAGVLVPVSLRSPTARVRTQGVYWLQVMYPATVLGAELGARRMLGALVARIFPTCQLMRAGQLVTVTTATPKGVSADAEWVTAAVAWAYYADADNPE